MNDEASGKPPRQKNEPAGKCTSAKQYGNYLLTAPFGNKIILIRTALILTLKKLGKDPALLLPLCLAPAGTRFYQLRERESVMNRWRQVVRPSIIISSIILVLASCVSAISSPISVSLRDGILVVDGRSFIPLLAIGQPPSDSHVSYARSLGFNTFLGNPDKATFSDQMLLDALRERGMKAIINYNGQLTSHSALLSWMLFCEPDEAGIPPAQVQSAHDVVRTSDALHPVFLQLSDGFYHDANYSYVPSALNSDRSWYTGYGASADILGFSMYPVSQWDRPDWLYIPGSSTGFLKGSTSAAKIVWTLVEASDADSSSTSIAYRGPFPEEVAFQAWDSIIQGASGIGYRTANYAWGTPIQLDPAVQAEMRKTNSEIESLTDVILNCPTLPGITVGESQNKQFHFTSRRTGSRCYVFACNADMNRTIETLSFSFPRLLATVTEVRSGRRVSAAGSTFADTFSPLGVNIYEVIFLPPSDMGRDHYVSPSGNNSDGASWANAWTELNQIQWSAVAPGDTIYLDGGNSSIVYSTSLNVGKAGTSDLARVVVRRSEEPDHNGIVRMEKQIKIWQPYVTLDGGEAEKFLVLPSDSMCGAFLGYWSEDATGSEIRNVSFIGNYSNPSALSVSIYGVNCLLKNCVFDRSAGEDMVGVMSTGDVTIEGCLFRNLIGANDPNVHRDVISVYPGIIPGKRLILRNNTFENNRTDNFGVFPSQGTVLGGFEIWGNTFRYCNTAIHYDDRVGGADYVNVYNNTFDNVRVSIHNNSPIAIDGTYNSIISSNGPTPTPALEPMKTPTPTAEPTESPLQSPTPTPILSETPTPAITPTATLQTPGLVIAYSFEDLRQSYVRDSSGLNNDGIIEGPTVSDSGYRGKGMAFDGVDDRITVPDSPRLNLTSGMTLEAWIYPPANITGWGPIICKEGQIGVLYSLFANSPFYAPLTILRVNGERPLLGGAYVPKEKWTFIASTYDGKIHRLYINGVAVAEQEIIGTLDISNGPVRVGANSQWSTSFPGIIDEVRVYDMALDPAQIVDDMNKPIPQLTRTSDWDLYE